MSKRETIALLCDMFDLLVEIKEELKAIRENTNSLAPNRITWSKLQDPLTWAVSSSEAGVGGPVALNELEDIDYSIRIREDASGVMWWDRANGVWRPMKELTLRKEQ